MSNLGKVYELRLKSRDKRVYPVVYMNKTYLYYKQPGCDELLRYTNPDSEYYSWDKGTVHYEDFKRRYEAGNIDESRVHYVYVPVHVQTFFEWIREKTPLELKIKRVQNSISVISQRIRNTNETIKHHKESVDADTAQRDSLVVYLEELNDKLQMEKDLEV